MGPGSTASRSRKLHYPPKSDDEVRGHTKDYRLGASNRISTAKYNLVSFVPKFLYELLSRVHNLVWSLLQFYLLGVFWE